MPEMTVKSAAKINLALDVTGKRPDGYHNIESVFQTVGLYDEITVKLTDSGINISCDMPFRFSLSDPIPCDERNIAYKTAKKYARAAKRFPEIKDIIVTHEQYGHVVLQFDAMTRELVYSDLN